ncbi:MAG TPA: MarR family transcriptional regulator [Acidimicrobiales bacterium]|jgi:DNA-binding MarR family transcriptional regulator|nr:MarR family transcriptional regulator [Acidimicrobiales bacterium]
MSISTNACPSGDEKVVLFGLLLETNARLTKELGAALESSCQLPLAWFEVLLQLRQSADGRLKMSQMADAIVHSTGGTTRLVDRLEEATFVRREHCPSDRRSVYVAITDTGNAKLDEALSVHLTYLNENMSTRLDDGERETLAVLLAKLNASR